MKTISQRRRKAITAEQLAALHPDDPVALAAAITSAARKLYPAPLPRPVAELRRNALREALALPGMTGAALGRRVGICQSRVSRLVRMTSGTDNTLVLAGAL